MSKKSTERDLCWQNVQTSIVHALEHFSCLKSEEGERPYHQKWIILSVSHAGECLRKTILGKVDEKCPSERKMIDLIVQLNEKRNEITHHRLPRDVDVSIASFCMMAILRIIRKKFRVSAEEFIEQYPPIQQDVVDAIRWNYWDEYTDFVESALGEEYPGTTFFPECHYCGANAIYESRCEACFRENLEKDEA